MTISPVVPAILPGTAASGSTTGSAENGTLFASILDLRTGEETETTTDTGTGTSLLSLLQDLAVPTADQSATTEGSGPVPVDAPAGPAPADVLGAAQIMAAAQVVPVTPVLAGAAAAGAPFTGDAAEASLAPSAETLAAPLMTEASRIAGDGSPASASAAADTSGISATPGTAITPTATTAGHAQSDGRGGHPSHRQPEGGVDPAGPVTATSAPANGSVPPAPVAATAGSAEASGPVTGQVFPEITRMVSRGDGMRRITIKLSPEALGDVQVTLTVRNGEVHVRMLGSELAQQALRAGAPELQRLLETIGATSSQVVVGDQGSSPDRGWQSGPQNGSQTDRQTDPHQNHRTAGTRDGDTAARDGKHGGPHPRSSTDPTATRGAGTHTHAGVDVSM